MATHHSSIQYRLGKITPTKNGQFATLWKRSAKGPIAPYDSTDQIDLVVIVTKTKVRCGLFIFTKDILIKQGIFSVKGKGGKRALRVYPVWDKPESKQAEKTQKWQLDFFLDLSNGKSFTGK
jgi:hypothetical protein